MPATMALRNPFLIPGRISSSYPCANIRPAARSLLACNWNQRSGLATSVSPAKGSKGPTAMVFLNMGGPSTTDDVEDFLSRLFVGAASSPC